MKVVQRCPRRSEQDENDENYRDGLSGHGTGTVTAGLCSINQVMCVPILFRPPRSQFPVLKFWFFPELNEPARPAAVRPVSRVGWRRASPASAAVQVDGT